MVADATGLTRAGGTLGRSRQRYGHGRGRVAVDLAVILACRQAEASPVGAGRDVMATIITARPTQAHTKADISDTVIRAGPRKLS